MRFISNCVNKINSRINGIDLTKGMSSHLCGHNHSKMHRRLVGGAILFIGVVVSKLGGDIFILHLAFDGIGYALHGIGLLPWVVDIEKLADK